MKGMEKVENIKNITNAIRLMYDALVNKLKINNLNLNSEEWVYYINDEILKELPFKKYNGINIIGYRFDKIVLVEWPNCFSSTEVYEEYSKKIEKHNETV